MMKTIFATSLFLVALFAVGAGKAQAQLDPPGEPKFKVGDRVEFDKLMAGDPSRAEWVKATVVRIDVQQVAGAGPQTSYVIKTDTGYQTSVTRRHAEGDPYWHSAGWFRPTADGGPPQPNADQPNNAPPNQPNPPPNDAAGGGKYKKGDCVDFDLYETGDATRAEWRPAKIVDTENVNLGGGRTELHYIVQLNQPGPNGLPRKFSIAQRMAEGGMTYAGDPDKLTGFLRPRGCDGNAPNIESAKLHTDANGNVTADRPLLDCDHLQTGPARNGQRPDSELMKKIIRCLWETPGTPGMHEPEKVDITQFAAGGTRGWIVNHDNGPGGTIDTVMWQFRVKYDRTSFHRDMNDMELGHEAMFVCYVAVDKWVCGTDATIKSGQTKRVEVTKQ